MNRQKEMARKALREKAGSAWSQASLPAGIDRAQSTVFTGYDQLEDQATVKYLLQTGADAESVCLADLAEAGQTVQVITDKTPFYASSGGQTGTLDKFIRKIAGSRCRTRQKHRRDFTCMPPWSKRESCASATK